MKRIKAGDPLSRSADETADNLNRLRKVFPEAFAEGKVDFDVLRQLLGDAVDDGDEKYGLNWHGKRKARQLALTPSTGTLRPCPEESVDWNTTQNLMIEGDNLEVLKLLQKSYAGKVKLIYIDPPYNTGKDFVYRDDYRDSIRNYLEVTGQVDGKRRKLSSNVETSGRFHTDWLNMMYPRLRLARELLAPDGVGFISLDGGEASRCRLLLEEVFGQENVLATITWVSNLKGRQISAGGPVGTHEYILCFGRDARHLGQFRGSHSEFKNLMPAVYKGKTYEVKYDDLGPYVTKNELHNTNSKFNETTAPTMVFCIHHNFSSGETRVTDVESGDFPGFVRIMPHDNATQGHRYHAWRWSRSRIERESHQLEFVPHGDSAKVYTKVRDVDGTALKDIVIGPSTGSGQKDLKVLGLAKAFDTPKPVDLLRVLLRASVKPDALVLDFFAGSASSAHAVMAQNAADGGKRPFIMVQFPEALDRRPAQKAAAATCQNLDLRPLVSEITKERLRRAGRRIKDENPGFSGDLGFRVFKLDTSNIRSWNSGTHDLDGDLLATIDHIEPDRTEQDLLYELLLKLGLDLCAPIETRAIGGNPVCTVGAGTLFACLAERIGGGGGGGVRSTGYRNRGLA